MRVLFADKMPEQARARLGSAGFEVRSEPGLEGAAMAEILRSWGPDVLVVRGTKVTKEHADATGRLSLVVRAGAGVNTIDVSACSARGIFVANCPGKNAVAVAELAFGLLLSIDRHIPENVADLRAGKWNKGLYSKARGLKGRTFGIIGLGEIGTAVAERAMGFEMPVVAWSRSLTKDRADTLGVQRATSPDEVARKSDVVSVHVALTPETKGLVSQAVFAAMRPGTVFLNTSRAEVVDEAALRRAIEERGLKVGLDVYSGEPSGKDGAFDHPLARHPAVIGTHHIGASTDQAQEAVGEETCRIIEMFRDHGEVPNCVNLLVHSAATHRITVRHLDRVGVLASVLDLMREAEINVQEMENVIFPDGAAIARVQVSRGPDDALLRRLAALEHVVAVSVVTLGG